MKKNLLLLKGLLELEKQKFINTKFNMKNVYIDKLNNIINKYINTDHSTIQMKPVDVNDNIYIDFGKDRNDKDSKFQVDDHVKISKYKNIFAKCYTPNWSEVFCN